MKIIPSFFLFLFLAGFCKAQDKTGVHQNMIRFQGTFAMGYNAKDWKYSIYGDAGFFIRPKLELNGGISYMLGSSLYELGGYTSNAASEADMKSHFLFAGPRYHFLPEKALDLYAGFQPGLALHQLDAVPQEFGNTVPAELGLAPATSLLAGAAWYGSFFHLFAELRYISSRHISPFYKVPASELRGCFGLGFNFN